MQHGVLVQGLTGETMATLKMCEHAENGSNLSTCIFTMNVHGQRKPPDFTKQPDFRCLPQNHIPDLGIRVLRMNNV